MKKLLLSVVVVFLSSCASLVPADKSVQRVFTYDYAVPGVEKDVLWTRARDYFAKSFGDSRSVLRVQDRESSTLIGKGAATWMLTTSVCASEYDLQFLAKDGKARLQLELNEGVPSYSGCQGWPWPSKSGYQEIVADFSSFSSGLESALKTKASFSDF